MTTENIRIVQPSQQNASAPIQITAQSLNPQKEQEDKKVQIPAQSSDQLKQDDKKEKKRHRRKHHSIIMTDELKNKLNNALRTTENIVKEKKKYTTISQIIEGSYSIIKSKLESTNNNYDLITQVINDNLDTAFKAITVKAAYIAVAKAKGDIKNEQSRKTN